MQSKRRRKKGKTSRINFLDAATGSRLKKKGKKTHPCKICNRFFPKTSNLGSSNRNHR